MYSVVRILERGRHTASDVHETARGRVEVMGRSAGFVTLLAILGDDGALVTVEIFETQDDMTAAQGTAGHYASRSPSPDGPEGDRTIAGEIVFQRGL
jgi:6-phosphofructokinase